MTGKADFTEEEWDLIREGPPTAGLVAAMASSGGSFRESWAIAKAYAEARKEHGASQLLDDLIASGPKTKRYHSAEEAGKEGLQRLGEAVSLLEGKADAGEVSDYKRFTLEVASRAAEAHKEKDQSSSVSAAEREAIDRIAASLNSG